MTTENNDGAFYDILNAGFDVDERKLLNTLAYASYKVLPLARHWTFHNLPDYWYDEDTSLLERVDILGFSIEAYLEMVFYCLNPGLIFNDTD